MAFGRAVTGDKAIILNLSTLVERTQRKILAKVIRRVQKPMVKSARKNLAGHKRTGQLEKSLGVVIRKYKGTSVWGVLGPRGRFRAELDGKPVDPIFYAHLAEGGHRVALSKTGGAATKGSTLRKGTATHSGDVQGIHFLEKSFDEHKANAEKTAKVEIAREIEKEATRQANKIK